MRQAASSCLLHTPHILSPAHSRGGEWEIPVLLAEEQQWFYCNCWCLFIVFITWNLERIVTQESGCEICEWPHTHTHTLTRDRLPSYHSRADNALGTHKNSYTLNKHLGHLMSYESRNKHITHRWPGRALARAVLFVLANLSKWQQSACLSDGRQSAHFTEKHCLCLSVL